MSVEQTEALARLNERIESGDIDHDDAADISALAAALKQREQERDAARASILKIDAARRQQKDDHGAELKVMRQRIADAAEDFRDMRTPTDAGPATNHLPDSGKMVWTPATTPPTSTGWYVVAIPMPMVGSVYRTFFYEIGEGWNKEGVRYYLPTPLPELPAMEAK